MITNIKKELEEESEFKVSYIDNQGNGVSLSNNKKFLIPGALKDETVLAQPMKIINRKVYCKLTKIKFPSNFRIKEDCSKFITCGGCNFRQVNNSWLQNWKLKKLLQKTDSLKIQKNIAYNYLKK